MTAIERAPELLPATQVPFAVDILRQIEDSGVVADYIEILKIAGERERDTMDPLTAASVLSKLSGAVVGLAGVGIKAAKGAPVQNNYYVMAMFNKTEDEIRAMSPDAQKLYGEMAMRAAETVGGSRG